MAKYTVGEITSMVKQNARMDMALIGSNDAAQNTYIWYYMTEALWKYAGLVWYKRTSDPLIVAANGPVTFQLGGVDIDDMYAQMYLLDATGYKVTKRTTYEDPTRGWYREGFNDPIDIRGNGTYRLVYRAYHPKITSANDPLMWPQTSYDLLMYETIGKIKQSKNDDQGAAAAFAIAARNIAILVKANADSYGSTGGSVPSQNEVVFYR